jgi:ribosome assembly protein YihI (activator of Der GTPase)
MPKRVGRPIKEVEEGERAALSLRVRPMIKKKLEDAADLNGRSLSQEAEFRLEHTFDRQSLLMEVITLAFGKDWASFIIFNGARFKQFNDETADRLRRMMDKLILSYDAEEHYRPLAQREIEKRKGRRS